MRVGFLPVIPRSIAEEATVNQLCINFENIRQQLNQPTMPIWTDEQVFDKMVDVVLSNPAKFKKLFPMMGTFHWLRVLQKFGGKLLKGSGLEDALIECGTFGPGVMETMLIDKHYYRSLAGFLIIENLVICLQWRAFWLIHNKGDYPFLTELESLAKSLAENQVQGEQFDQD